MNYRFCLVFFVSCISSLVLVIFTFLFFSGNNPLEINGKVDYQALRLVPQGWAFFTRSPREAQILLYEITSEGKLRKFPHKHSSYRNLFGINRKSSKLLTEIQGIKSKIPDSLFNNTKWNYQSSSTDLTSITNQLYSIRNEVYSPIMCGKYALFFQKPIPWAWLESRNSINMPAKVIYLEVSCDENIEN